MRGPSGRGASRAKEKGASRLARRLYRLLHPSVHKTRKRPFPLNVRQTFLLGRTRPRQCFARITKHETRITAFMFFTRYETRDTNHGFFGTSGTEALQSCFFCPGLLGNSTRRRSPCGSRIRASQAFTSRNPLILRSLRNTNHETRVTAFMFFTNHEARNTTHGCCVFHESRDTKHGLFGTCWY